AACAKIGSKVLRSICVSGIKRLQHCIDANERHFQHL
ncbi:hypothetical protein EAG_14185, partial [Camponotus floridanus]